MKRHNERLLQAIYDYVIEYQKETGSSPTLRKIMARYPRDLTSTSKLKGYIDVLNARGLLDKEKNGKIAVNDKLKMAAVPVPIVGTVACGQPILAVEDIEGSVAVSPELFRQNDNLIMLRAKGHSMKQAGIDIGDLIVINKRDYANYGEMVLALIGEEATVKTYRPQEDGSVILHPENDDYEDIYVDECVIQGIVVGCIKTF